MRHPDFQKIYNQFLQIPEGLKRYAEWIQKLNLDESKPYGNCFREAWHNRHVDFRYWKEDRQATYWKVEVGFPVESMNRNVYTKEELKLASRTLQGGYVNINHKFPLPTVTIPASEAVTNTVTLPDGTQVETVITEAIVRVPNNLMCPVCHTEKTINQLIQENGIVNVSLEASCNYITPDSRCEGMNFDGFAFLTSKVLPGIPLTRIMPLESIMIEALQTSSITPVRVKKMKLKMEAVDNPEQPCPEGQKMNPDTGKCEQLLDTRGMDNKAILPDEAGQCPPGYILSTAMGQCIPNESCPDGQHWDAELGKCTADTSAAPAKSVVAVGKSPAPEELLGNEPTNASTGDPSNRPYPKIDIPAAGARKDVKVPQIPTDGTGDMNALPTGVPPYPTEPFLTAKSPAPNAHECPDGYEWSHEANACVPSSPIAERIARMKAEDRAKFFEKQSLEFQKRYAILENALNNVRGVISEQKATIEKLEKRTEFYNLNKVEDEIKYRELKRRVEDLTLDVDDKRRKLDKLTEDYTHLSSKYEDSRSTATELVKRNNEANEEILKYAKKAELLEAQNDKQRNLAKKIVRIKA